MAEDRKHVLKQLIENVTGTELSGSSKKIDWADKIATKPQSAVDRGAVMGRLMGTVEKFRVLGRLDLAEALEARAEEVGRLMDHKYVVAQVTSMLLDLQQSPLSKSVPKLGEQEKQAGNQLTWEEIIAKEPLEGDHWLESEQEESEGESEYEQVDEPKEHDELADEMVEMTFEPRPKPLETYAATGTTAERRHNAAQLILDQSYWTRRYRDVSESNVSRECLLAMMGHPCEMFRVDIEDGLFHVEPVSILEEETGYKIAHMSRQVLFNVLRKIAGHATAVAQLRQFSDQFFIDKQFPEFQYRFVFGILDKISRRVGNAMLALQQSLVASPQVVSLMRLEFDIERIVSPYTALVKVIKKVATLPNTRVALLDVLMEDLYAMEMAGPQDGSSTSAAAVLQEVFVTVFREYPLREWLEYGYTKPGFFVQEIQFVDISRYWANGHQQHSDLVPKILQSEATRVYETGKAAGFLRLLGSQLDGRQFELPEYDSVDKFIGQLHGQIRHIHRHATARLSTHLLEHCGLKRTLQTHFDVFLVADTTGAMAYFLNEVNHRSLGLSRTTTTTTATAAAAAPGALDRHFAADALDEAWHGQAPCTVTAVNSDTKLVELAIPLLRQSPALCNVVPPQVVYKYGCMLSTLQRLSRIHAHCIHQAQDHAAAAVVGTVMANFHLFVVLDRVHKFWKQLEALSESASSSVNVIKLHENLAEEIYSKLPKFDKYESTGDVNDIVCDL